MKTEPRVGLTGPPLFRKPIPQTPGDGVFIIVLTPFMLAASLLNRPAESPPPLYPAREVLEPRSQEYFLENLNHIICSYQDDPFIRWPGLLRELQGIDPRLRVHYYRDGIYFIADPTELTEDEHHGNSEGLATVIRERAPDYKGHFLVCATENGRHRVFEGGGRVPWLTKDEHTLLKKRANFYGNSPDLIQFLLDSPPPESPTSSLTQEGIQSCEPFTLLP